MPRQARIESPTGYYHIIMRGNNKEYIFNTSRQKQYFKDLLVQQAEEGLISLACYCIMDNHVHLLVNSDLDNLTKAIKIINIKFAMYLNRKLDRSGHVFQDRFKSEIVNDDKYLLQVTRYIHNNPVKAKIVKSPGDYRWSSYIEFKDGASTISERQRKYILGFFSTIGEFTNYSNLPDMEEYLEIEEDRDRYRHEQALSIISEFFAAKGLGSWNQEVSTHVEQLVNLLLSQSKLSHRQIADILNVDRNFVHRVNKSSII